MAIAVETKACRKCRRVLATEEFPWHIKAKGLRMARCRTCKNEDAREWQKANPQKAKDWSARWHAANREQANAGRRERHRLNPDQKRARDLMVFYGMTIEQYEEMLTRQGGVCVICHGEETRTRQGKLCALTVDHDHDTGRVRGLLCSNCNVILGMAEDDPGRLQAAIDYLQEA